MFQKILNIVGKKNAEMLVALLAFFISWFYFIFSWEDKFWGYFLGWVPAIGIAIIAGMLWLTKHLFLIVLLFFIVAMFVFI